MDLVAIITEYGFPITMSIGMAYFIYYIWTFINEELEPKIEEMHFALIRVIDKMRMLDQDLIRLKEKTNVVLRYRTLMRNDDKIQSFRTKDSTKKTSTKL
jgi:hypothetical protein